MGVLGFFVGSIAVVLISNVENENFRNSVLPRIVSV